METVSMLQKKGHKDTLRSYYTDDDTLVSYMVRLLNPTNGDVCLEPSAGSGCFIDGLLATQKELDICAIEISHEASHNLKLKYQGVDNITIFQDDFLQPQQQIKTQSILFDRIIANPPYGGWQEYERRDYLKSRFPDLYVKETYGIFVAHSLTQLKPGGRSVYILPETFLYLHLQKGLRKRLLEQYSIQSVDVFPSSVFPGVNFGYAKLCIICIDNYLASTSHSFSIRHSNSLSELISQCGKTFEVNQALVINRPEYTFPLLGYSQETSFIDSYHLQLGDIADCVTGIYSGADTQFLYRSPENLRGVSKYPEIEKSRLYDATIEGKLGIDGLEGNNCFIPVLKGGGFSYFKPELWFFDWSSKAVMHYKTDKKARFQNSHFYFKKGIGFPMVSSGRSSASVIKESWIFDQSVVGIFPKSNHHFCFLLAFLNSSTCWRLLRQINPSTNNSAKYIKRLPIVLPTVEGLAWFEIMVSEYLHNLELGKERNMLIEQQLDEEVGSLYAEAILRYSTIEIPDYDRK